MGLANQVMTMICVFCKNRCRTDAVVLYRGRIKKNILVILVIVLVRIVITKIIYCNNLVVIVIIFYFIFHIIYYGCFFKQGLYYMLS